MCNRVKIPRNLITKKTRKIICMRNMMKHINYHLKRKRMQQTIK